MVLPAPVPHVLALSILCIAALQWHVHAARQELGLLQVKTSASERSCPLPEDSTWAEVRLKDLPAFQMAVRTNSDPLSKEILEKGYWENDDPSIWGKPGHALDIGGNIGYYTFALANAGWYVETFEPLAHNNIFILATMCKNPEMAKRVRLLDVGLGADNMRCGIHVDDHNIGNGVMRCDGDASDFGNPEQLALMNFKKAGTFKVRKLEEVLHENYIANIDFLKIDVEGYECEVLRGAGGANFLSTYKPRLVKSEVWKDMERCGSLEYFDMFENAGYRISMDSDPQCKEGVNYDTKYWAIGGNFYMCRDY